MLCMLWQTKNTATAWYNSTGTGIEICNSTSACSHRWIVPLIVEGMGGLGFHTLTGCDIHMSILR